MGFSRHELAVFSKLAALLEDFLPAQTGKAEPDQASFMSIAGELGLEKYWIAGEVKTAIGTLIAGTLTHRKDRFAALVLRVIEEGVAYRAAKGYPVVRAEIVDVSSLLVDLGIKIGRLCQPGFLDRFGPPSEEELAAAAPSEKPTSPAPETEAPAVEVPSAPARAANPPSGDGELGGELDVLRQGFFGLSAAGDDELLAGPMFEQFLCALFRHFDLVLKKSFVVAEGHIVGAFVLDGVTYPVQARWDSHPPTTKELLFFAGRLQVKAPNAIGCFISLAGITPEADAEMETIEQTNLIVVSGIDLSLIVENRIDLVRALREKLSYRKEGRIHVPAAEFLAG